MVRKMQITPYGARLREARKAAGYTIIEITNRVGVAPNSISRYERGECLPSMATALKLAVFLGKPLSWFVQDYGKEATK